MATPNEGLSPARPGRGTGSPAVAVMATPDEGPPPAPKWTSHALEWGIGSIIIGLLLLLVGPLAGAVVAVALYLDHAAGFTTVAIVEMTFDLGAIGIGVSMLLAGLGLWFGIRGVRHARTRNLPAGISATGVVICSVVLIALGIALVVTLGCRDATLEDFHKRGMNDNSLVR
jgi:hypothetical protein